jgi:protein tyrosine phosphatase (PTP) superfamily phosphohydrolase (DUF442 family)
MKRRLVGPVVLGCLTGLALAGAAEVGRVVLGSNWHEVVPGRVYRSAQLSGDDLERAVRVHGVRTVVNLRGCSIPLPWYVEECRASHRLAVAQEDIYLSANRLPSGAEVRRLVEVLDRSEYPVLLHCRQGADRTGLAAVSYLLLRTDTPLPVARRQLGPRYGHVALDRAAHLDRFFDLYEDWLGRQGRSHSNEAFRAWVAAGYCPGECRCSIEPLGVPTRVRTGQAASLRVRVHNTSLGPWRLRPENNAGIHLGCILTDGDGRGVGTRRAGMFHAEVAPGESIELTMVLPALRTPGRYRYLLDMVDEKHCWFYQTGSEPFEGELEVDE